MKKGEKLYTDDGTQVLLFPLEYMYITQGEGGSYSHSGTKAMDFQGYGADGRVYNCPYYAPCDLVCVRRSDTAVYNIWDSKEPVLCADGVKRNVSIWNIHSANLYDVGTELKQGDLLGVTSKLGEATGDHVHLEMALNHYTGQELTNGNQWSLKGAMSLYDGMFINDTIIVKDYDYKWVEYDGSGFVPIIPSINNKKRKKFPFVLYARKLRGEHMY